ncbi:MAG: immune inhibitor A domain-containing protein, partial [Bacteroidales bacterium]
MRKITFFILFIFLCFNLFLTFNNAIAGSAYPYPIEFKQPNGNIITIQLKGDEKVRWAETIDKYAILFNSKGDYEYAVLDANHNMVPSGILAKNASERSFEDLLFLSNIPKSLHYSDSQIQMMLSAWDIVNQTGPQNVFPTTGSRNLVCILIGYTDLAFTKTQADFNNLFNQINYTSNGATGSVKDYYLETSYNQFNLTVTVAGPYTASNTMAYYGAPDGANHDSHTHELVTEAVTLANPDVNYANFDNDGDNIVDGVYVIYAGYNEGAGASVNAIWYHSS